MMKNLIIIWLLIGFPIFVLAQTIDATVSKVKFEISNFAFNTVEGTFTGLTGDINFKPDDLSNSTFDVCIDVATVNTENEKRDEHLRGEDFFNIKNHPKICFVSSAITSSKGGFKATGELSMNGITKTIDLPFSYKNQQFEGTFEVERLDYKIGPSNGFSVGKTVEIKIICVVK